MPPPLKSALSVCLLFFACLLPVLSRGQSLLDKPVSVDVRSKPLREVLTMIGKQGGFYFSYSSAIVPNDSLITISVRGKSVRSILEQLLKDRCQYKEIDNHIVILPAETEKWYRVSGHLVNAWTGEKVFGASVFEEQQLVSTLTDASGYFELKLKDKGKYESARIRVSSGFYKDTVVSLTQGFDQQVDIQFTPADHLLKEFELTLYAEIERSWFGRHFLSSKLRKQSTNLTKFFVDKPVQFSFTPGLGTHGKLSGQVTNNFSFNVLGGYSAGVNGFELGGIFNISKKDAKYVQVAGVFNIISGSAEGVQVGGVLNNVAGSVRGVQVSGVVSHIGKSADGVVVAGVSSHVSGVLSGVQVSGITNITSGRMEGFQLSGIANISTGDVRGMQLSGFVNKAKHVRGMQFGIINIADSIDGYCLGIFNIVKHGYHKLAIYSNETFNVNAAYKAGTRKLYSVLSLNLNAKPGAKAYSYGYGIGTDVKITRKLLFSAELTANHLFLGDTATTPSMFRLQPSLCFSPIKKLAIVAGPTLAFCPALPGRKVEGYMSDVASQAMKQFPISGSMVAWVGWQVGIVLF